MPLDDRLRRGLPGLASGVEPDPEEALNRVLAAGRRRRALRWVAAGATAAVVLAVAGVAVPRLMQVASPERPSGFAGKPSPDPSAELSADPTAEPTEPTAEGSRLEIRGRCAGHVGFRPTYLPDGFSPSPVDGPAPGAPPADDGQGVVHWTDGERAIEIRRPGMLFVELAQEEGAPTITVLGQETADYGPLAPNYEEGPAGEDFVVQFRYPADSEPSGDPSKDCSFYSITEYGLDEAELIKVAEGLEPGG